MSAVGKTNLFAQPAAATEFQEQTVVIRVHPHPVCGSILTDRLGLSNDR
jgi:hypothetical protein